MSEFVFKPGPPKPADVVTLSWLKTAGVNFIGFKDVGDSLLVYSDGPKNYYISDTRDARAWLRKTLVNEV